MKEFQCQVGIGGLTAVALLLVAWAGGAALLGAHPFWDVQVVWVGAAISVLARALIWPVRTRNSMVSILVSVGLLIAVALTIWGKSRFVASYAEDYLAGRFWYFGWIGIAGFFHALIWQNAARLFCRRAR